MDGSRAASAATILATRPATPTEQAIDRLRERFGEEAVVKGLALEEE